jgi:protein-disulfide isomerase
MPDRKDSASRSRISNLNSPQLTYVLLLVAVFLVGYLLARVQSLEGGFGGSRGTATQGTTGNPAQPGSAGGQAAPQGKVDVANGHLPVKGDEDAKVTIVEFTDFECPFCGSFYRDTLPQIVKEYIDTGKAKLYIRHYPLSFHPKAIPLANAAECANDQDKFWEMHDKIFDNKATI